MGSDNLFHKRKAKSVMGLRRHASKREAYAKILIVCEGEKTEPNYFGDVRDFYALSTANVALVGCGTDPVSIVDTAKQRYRQEKDAGDGFDKVFCVFDRDSHSSYARAIESIAAMKPKDTFFAVTSVPCFEYWLLLHFVYTTKPYIDLPGKSAAEQVLSELRSHMPGYRKGLTNVFSTIVSRLNDAKIQATRALQAASTSGTDNPSTRAHELVDFMQRIKG